MSLPSLATFTDVQVRDPDTVYDPAQVAALLSDASALVRAYTGQTWFNEATQALEGVPEGVAGLVASMVIRAVVVQPGVVQQTVGNYSVSFDRAAARLYLTAAEKALLDTLGASGMPRAFSIDTAGEPGWLGPYMPEELVAE